MSYRKEYIFNNFQELIFKETGKCIDKIENLMADASDRKIYRIYFEDKSVIGVFNENEKENLAFIKFTATFRKLGLNVPQIFRVSDDNMFYTEEDLGNMTLFRFISQSASGNNIDLYKKCLSDLLKFQISSKDEIDYSFCYQTSEFNLKVIEYDLDKFIKYFLQIYPEAVIDERTLSDILDLSEKVLSRIRKDFFLYRDFQPRNIMLKNNNLYYIDYQSGRKGPLQYDVASFLFSGSIEITNGERHILLEHYINEMEKYADYDRNEFLSEFYFFAFLRLLQMLGSYSYLNISKNNTEVLKKIPKALKNLSGIIKESGNIELNAIISNLISFGK